MTQLISEYVFTEASLDNIAWKETQALRIDEQAN